MDNNTTDITFLSKFCCIFWCFKGRNFIQICKYYTTNVNPCQLKKRLFRCIRWRMVTFPKQTRHNMVVH